MRLQLINLTLICALAANQLRGNDLCGAAEEGLGQSGQILSHHLETT